MMLIFLSQVNVENSVHIYEYKLTENSIVWWN
jgi:hypothetical protein